MDAYPGAGICCGRKRNPRTGTILAIFEDGDCIKYIATVAHVITGNRGVNNINIRNQKTGKKLANYQSGVPVSKIRSVDFLLSRMDPDIAWTNTVSSGDITIHSIGKPTIGASLNLHGKNGTYKGVIKALKVKNKKLTFKIRCLGKKPKKKDSGGPWFTESGELIGVHKGSYSGKDVLAHSLQEVVDHFKVTLPK